MSLKPLPVAPIPDDTSSRVEPLFPYPERDIYRIIGDRFSDFVCDADFADLYPAEGQPGLSPALLAMVTVLQFMENVSDRQAARFVIMRMDWKYALRLPMDHPGFDHSVLCEFRNRLLENDATIRPFGKLLGKLKDEGLLSGRGRQRTDSFAVLSAARALSRLELVMETLRYALRAVERVDADWLWTNVPPEWAERYGDWTQEERLVKDRGEKGRAQAKRLGKRTGQDGLRFLAALDAQGTPEALLALPEVIQLRAIWEQQYEVREGEYQWREKLEVPSAQVIQTSRDPGARLGKQGEAKHIGYRTHITETVAEDKPRIITDVETTAATTHDAQTVASIQGRLEERCLLPDEHLADTNYISAHTLAHSEAQGVDLIGPARENTNAQAQMEEGLSLEKFTIDWAAQQVRCPCGQLSVSWAERKNEQGVPEVHVHFASAGCSACPRRAQCMTGQGSDKRGRNLKFHVRYDLLQRRRQEQKTEAFREIYHSRAGIEATGSEMIRAHGMRQARYVGQAKVALQNLMIATATNLKRAARWVAGEERNTVRRRSLQGPATAAA